MTLNSKGTDVISSSGGGKANNIHTRTKKVTTILAGENNEILSDFIFAETTNTRKDLENRYPPRGSDVIVSRFAPSPTGFMHVGGIYNALIAEKFVHSNGGVFILRIEDTDQKREIPGATEGIIRAMKTFGINMDEYPLQNNGNDQGEYGPYIQTKRAAIYKVFAKELVSSGLAYPCFLTPEEVESIRKEQEAQGITPGIYGSYSPWKNADINEVYENISEGKPFVLRFHSPGSPSSRRIVHDEIHGSIEMQDNYADVVLLKSDGIPTYHFAHIVDDYLMRTTHVIRGDEWIPSLPLHIQLFEAFGIAPPKYVHMAPLMKMENGNKRKLSKRKDPEANVEYFFLEGYPNGAVIEYLCNIMDSRFEDWRKENPHLPVSDFDFDLSRLGKSGSLFDPKKLTSVSNGYISRLANDELFRLFMEWLERNNPNTFSVFSRNADILRQGIAIERLKEKDPKRYSKLSEITPFLSHFLDESFQPNQIEFSSNFPKTVIVAFLRDYRELLLKIGLGSKDAWLDGLKKISVQHGFSLDNNQFKTGGFIGKLGDSAMMLRLSITGSARTQDLYEVMNTYGIDRCVNRISQVISMLEE